MSQRAAFGLPRLNRLKRDGGLYKGTDQIRADRGCAGSSCRAGCELRRGGRAPERCSRARRLQVENRTISLQQELVTYAAERPLLPHRRELAARDGSGLVAVRNMRRARATPSFTKRTSFTSPS